MQRVQWQDVAVPLVLLLTGSALLGADWAGVLSLDRIAHLWPSALILIGLCASLGTESGSGVRQSQSGEQGYGR